MDREKRAEEDLKRSLRYVRRFLRIVGAWPRPISAPLRSRILDWCLILTSYLMQLLVLIPGFLHIVTKEKVRERQLQKFMPHVTGLGQLFKYTIILCKTSEFRQVLNKIRDDWLMATEEHRLILIAKAKIGHKVVLTMFYVLYFSGVCYRTILPLSIGRIVLPNNTTMRILPCPSYFVFIDEQASPYYEIIFVIQVLEGMLMYTIVCGTVGAYAVLSLHICSLLTILVNKMIELSNKSDTSEDVIKQRIFDIVEYQTRVKRFLSKVEEIASYLCFIEVVCDTSLVCAIGYCIVTEWEHSNATAIMIYLMFQTLCIFTTFMICYIGQLIIEESNNVRLTSITLDWYRFPTKEARCLIPIIIASSYPIKLTICKVQEISLSTFTDLMKTSLAYLNILRKVA
ncbi:odorant receptor 43a-like [Xylocopa sonorina]|uniref:odorant receptor 43a-like n=1 Tax=Xylocopa sonorina TaxID=1818115 RepID=UPI00403B262F